MSDCPYFDASHSMADLHYVCKAGNHKRKISTEDINSYPCFTDEYIRCRHYQKGERAEETEE